MWPEDRRTELAELQRLLRLVSTLNRGSGFLENAQRSIEIAEMLTESDLRAPRPSFMQFLISQASKGGRPMKTTDDLARPFIAEDWTDHCPGYYRSMNLEGFAAAIRAQALAAVTAAIEGERLEDYPNNDGDAGYAAAVEDCLAAAIRALAGAPATKGE